MLKYLGVKCTFTCLAKEKCFMYVCVDMYMYICVCMIVYVSYVCSGPPLSTGDTFQNHG